MDGELEVLDGAADTGSEVSDEPIESADGSGVAEDVSADTENTRGDAGERSEEDAGDGRQVTAKIRTHLAELKKADPALAKELQRIYWKGQNVDKLGTTQELTTLKEAVELHGGVEGITKLAEEVEAGRALEQGFERGDPKVVDGWANDYPEGFKRLIPAALDRLEKMDEARFDQVGSNVSDRIFEKYGVYSAVQLLGEALTANKPEDAVKHFNALTKFLSDMKGLSKRTKENPYQQRESELDQREKDIAERDKKAFYGSVRSDVNTQVSREMNKEIAKLMRGKKFASVDQGNRVRGQITEELKRLINTGDYSKRYESVMGQRDRDKAIAFIVSNANRNMSKAVQAVLKDFNLLGTTNGRPAPRTVPRTGANATPQAVVGRPKISDVDFSKTDKATFLGARQHGTAWLKNGRQAKW
jgi:hypothetical protein